MELAPFPLNLEKLLEATRASRVEKLALRSLVHDAHTADEFVFSVGKGLARLAQLRQLVVLVQAHAHHLQSERRQDE
eukprot:6172954-Pleurochrysis_carterae.AAC.1